MQMMLIIIADADEDRVEVSHAVVAVLLYKYEGSMHELTQQLDRRCCKMRNLLAKKSLELASISATVILHVCFWPSPLDW